MNCNDPQVGLLPQIHAIHSLLLRTDGVMLFFFILRFKIESIQRELDSL